MDSRNKSQKIPYFDAHCDTLTLATDTDRDLFCTYTEEPFALRLSEESFSPRAQVFAIYGDSAQKGFDPDKRFFSAYSHFRQQLLKHSDKLMFCRSSSDLDIAAVEGKIAVFLSIEGAEILSCSVEKLENAHSCGVLITGITWDHANILSGSCIENEDEGLTSQGIHFVDKIVSLDMLADISHLSPRGADEVIERCKGKAFASHSNSKIVMQHKRNLTDAQFIKLVNYKSMCCINLYTPFISTNTALPDNVADHIIYLASIAPNGLKHIGIGADFDGCDLLPIGLEDSSKIDLLYNTLMRRGLTTSEVDDVFYYNMYRYLKSNI